MSSQNPISSRPAPNDIRLQPLYQKSTALATKASYIFRPNGGFNLLAVPAITTLPYINGSKTSTCCALRWRAAGALCTLYFTKLALMSFFSTIINTLKAVVHCNKDKSTFSIKSDWIFTACTAGAVAVQALSVLSPSLAVNCSFAIARKMKDVLCNNLLDLTNEQKNLGLSDKELIELLFIQNENIFLQQAAQLGGKLLPDDIKWSIDFLRYGIKVDGSAQSETESLILDKIEKLLVRITPSTDKAQLQEGLTELISVAAIEPKADCPVKAVDLSALEPSAFKAIEDLCTTLTTNNPQFLKDLKEADDVQVAFEIHLIPLCRRDDGARLVYKIRPQKMGKSLDPKLIGQSLKRLEKDLSATPDFPESLFPPPDGLFPRVHILVACETSFTSPSGTPTRISSYQQQTTLCLNTPTYKWAHNDLKKYTTPSLSP